MYKTKTELQLDHVKLHMVSVSPYLMCPPVTWRPFLFAPCVNLSHGVRFFSSHVPACHSLADQLKSELTCYVSCTWIAQPYYLSKTVSSKTVAIVDVATDAAANVVVVGAAFAIVVVRSFGSHFLPTYQLVYFISHSYTKVTNVYIRSVKLLLINSVPAYFFFCTHISGTKRAMMS